MTVSTIYELLRRQAERTPEAAAILGPDRDPLSYGRLFQHVRNVVAWLNDWGIGRNDRVAAVLPNGAEIAVAFLGVAGVATFAPLNPSCRETEFEFDLSDLSVKGLIVQSGLASPARAVANALGIPVIELTPALEEAAGIFALSAGRRAPACRGALAQADDVALVLHTSGTTSRPKIVPLTHSNLCASAQHIRSTLGLTERDVCLNVMPLFHIHGLIGTMLSSLAAGAGVVCTPGFDAVRFFEWLDTFRPTWYSAVPTMHQAVLAQAAAHRHIIARSPLRFVRSSSASLPRQVMTELEHAFEAPVIESYGMTEAAHQMASNPLPPGQRKPGSVGPAAGPEVAVVDEAGKLLAPGAVGEIVIRGPNVMTGYENNPAANQGAFTNGWLRTGDQGYKDADGYLFITGRIKEIINRGGEKIAPREVDEAFMDHPAVAQVVAFAVPHATLGEDVVVAVVLKDNASVTARELRAFAAARLSGHKVPSQVIIVDEIPRGPTGKLQRIGLAEWLQAKLRPEFVAPGNPLEAGLAGMWRELLKVERVGIHDNFFALGGDSLQATQLVARVRAAFQVRLLLKTIFEDPTIAEQARVIEDLLLPEAARLSEDESRSAAPSAKATSPQRSHGQARPRPAVRDVTTAAGRSSAPLSYAQQRFWFFDQWAPNVPLYNSSVALRLRGALNVPALEQSVTHLLLRHEPLRTVFDSVDGEPRQRVVPNVNVTLPVEDLSGSAPGEALNAARASMETCLRQPFDLTLGPPVRVRLYRLASGDHLLLFVTHHIVFDAWSEDLWRNELGALYESFSNGEPAGLPALPFRYLDFVRWQRAPARRMKLEESLRYWKDHLSGELPVLDLPADRPRPAVRTFRGASERAMLAKPLVTGLKELGRREGVTLFMILLAAYKVLLYRYTGQGDCIVGCPVHGRRHVDTEKLIGTFVDMLALRTRLSGHVTYRQVLEGVRQTFLQGYEHQDVPLEWVVEALHPGRDLSRTPLFQVVFDLKNLPPVATGMPGLSVEALALDKAMAFFDLALELVQIEDVISCRFEYNPDLFDATRIERMIGHFQTLLEGIVADPEQHVADLPLLTAAERQQLLAGRNDTRVDYPPDVCVHDLVAAQAARSPAAIAVVFGGEQVSYRELEARANRLAHFLRERGVGPGVLVGMCVERSVEMVVGLLGILKAGGAYVPLDPDYPAERLAFMVEDGRLPVVLTQARLAGALPMGGAEVIRLDADWAEIARRPDTNPVGGVGADDLAYVIYTSGSTGRPKGVQVPHRGVVNWLRWMQAEYRLTSAGRVLHKMSLNFDASVCEVFWPLITGARLVVARPDGHKDSAYLIELIEREQITVAYFVPSMLAVFLEDAGVAQCTSLRQVLCVGEALPHELQERFFARLGSTELHNSYGPTETTIGVLYWACQRESGRPIVPIGFPIANTQAYVLDGNLQPVPVGVVGELHIGGVPLAWGYLRRPELTAEKFIPNPFSREPGQRLYKTGDMTRYLPDGAIEFLGRADHQVKLRGIRIEPGEIEAVLGQHADVHQSLVVVREDLAEGRTDQRLVAYVVPRRGAEPAAGELRRYLKARLPEYMVPAAFVRLDALPVTSTGKVDRRALPAPDATGAGREGQFVAPRGPDEERLAAIWADILGVDRVGIYDDFFDLGGHSLLATRVMSRVRKAFELDLPLVSLFEQPTVAGLGACIETMRWAMRGPHRSAGEALVQQEEGEV